jgi:hypothetical protein
MKQQSGIGGAERENSCEKKISYRKYQCRNNNENESGVTKISISISKIEISIAANLWRNQQWLISASVMA